VAILFFPRKDEGVPFVALDVSDKRVNILEADDLIAAQAQKYLCPLCKSPMGLRAVRSQYFRPHFAHFAACTSPLYRPESYEHLITKERLIHDLKTRYGSILDINIEPEVIIPEANRVADVLITFPMGWRIAHEIQLSSITVSEIQQRTDDYARCGIDTVWWLGKAGDSNAIRKWCTERFGYYLSLRFETIESQCDIELPDH
jgi:competence protein CoiA